MRVLHSLLFVFIVTLSMVSLSSNVLGFGCMIRSGSCNAAEVCLFSLYSSTNSHAADCSTYNYKVCCDFASSAIRASCNSDETGTVSLNKISNSHVEIYGYLNYGNHVCVKESLNCTIKASCDTDDICVASFYRDLNSHAAACYYYSNKLCCRTAKVYVLKGIASYYDTGLPISSGVVIGIIKETGDTAYATISDGSFMLKFNVTLNATLNKFTLGLIINSSDNKIGYAQLVAGSGEFVSSIQTCSIKQWHFTGRAVDSSGLPINSGNVMISVKGETQTYTNSTIFSGGVWDIYISPCLVSGKLYTFQVIISSGDKLSQFTINQVAK